MTHLIRMNYLLIHFLCRNGNKQKIIFIILILDHYLSFRIILKIKYIHKIHYFQIKI